MKLDFESNTSTFTNIGSDFLESVQSDDNTAELTKMVRDGIHAAQNGKPAQARSLLLSVTEIDPNNEKAWLWLASISEYPEELLVFLNNVLRINPDNERALDWAGATKSLLSKTFVQRGIEASNEKSDRAKQYFFQAVMHDDKNEMAWLWLASLSNSEEEKSSHLKKVLNIDPENQTAKSLLEAIDQKKREKLFQSAAENASEGNTEQAVNLLDEYISQSPYVENAWLLKSFLVQPFNEKSECWEQVLSANPENELARMNLEFLRSMAVMTGAEQPENDIELSEPFTEESENDILSVQMPDEEVRDKKVEESDPAAEFYASQTEEETAPAYEMHFSETEPEELIEESEAVSFAETADAVPEEAQTHFEFSEETTDVSYAEENNFTDSEPQHHTPEFAETDDSVRETSDNIYSFYSETENSFPVAENVEESGHFSFEAFSEAAAQPELEINSGETCESAETEFDSEISMESYAQTPEAEEETGETEVYEFEAEAENNYSDIFEQAENASADAESDNFELDAESEMEAMSYAFEEKEIHPQIEMVNCAFCKTEIETQSFVCGSCHAVQTLSNLEMILANHEVDKEKIQNALYQMEAEKEMRSYDLDETKRLALGHLNIGNYERGLIVLIEASKMNPDDIVLSSQINALKIRLEELEKHRDIHNPNSKNLTILVVDDSATVRKLISGKLEKSGHEVVCAIDGIDALDKMKDMVPDLVLLDINMPRMDGYQVCKLIRNNEETKDVPVVMISGKDGFFDKVRGRMAGTTGYITKPFGPETLMKTVESYIN